jgi:hypothetical protein
MFQELFGVSLPFNQTFSFAFVWEFGFSSFFKFLEAVGENYFS